MQKEYNPRGGIIVTENGCAVQEDDVDEALKDIERAVYLKRYLTEVRGGRGGSTVQPIGRGRARGDSCAPIEGRSTCLYACEDAIAMQHRRSEQRGRLCIDTDGSVRLRLVLQLQHACSTLLIACSIACCPLQQVHKAILHDDVDVRGYFVWSLLDNFE